MTTRFIRTYKSLVTKLLHFEDFCIWHTLYTVFRKKKKYLMGGAKKFDYPKYVWSPSGGWWCEPRNWRRNTAIGFGIIFAICIPTCWLSWQLERRPVPPYRHILSQRFAKHAKEDDPSLP